MSLLPAGYKRLLYIESTGTQWVDTGFVPTATSKIIAEVQYKNLSAAEYSGLYVSGYPYLMFGIGNSVWEYYIGTAGVATTTPVTAQRTTVVLDVPRKGATYGGNFTGTPELTFGTHTLTMPIFTLRQGQNSFRNYSNMKLFSYKIYNANALVRNFIPCTNDAGEIGLYDTVGGQFYGNSGTGVFIAGPEFWYDKLEYIESSGTQYVDTGFKPNQDTRIVMNAKVLNVSGNNTSGFLFGSGYPVQQNGFEAYAFSGAFSAVYNGVHVNGGSVSVGDVLLVDFNKNKCKVTRNGSDFYENTFTYTSFVSPVNLTLLMLPRQSKYYGVCELYSCQIYDNGNLIRDYVPAKLPDGSIGLIDKLTDEFYPNMGTGTFIAGPVAKEEIPPRKVTVDLIPPMTGEKTEDFTIEYSVVDDAETETFEVVEYIDDVESRSLSVVANERVSSLIESTGMGDGLHTFMLIVDGTVEVEYSFHVNNTTAKVEATELSINMPTTVNVNEKFLISVIITELSFTIAKLKIHAGDVYSGEV